MNLIEPDGFKILKDANRCQSFSETLGPVEPAINFGMKEAGVDHGHTLKQEGKSNSVVLGTSAT